MRKIICSGAIWLLMTGSITAQQLQGKAWAPLAGRRDIDKMCVVDSGNVRVLYAFNAKDINDAESYIDMQRLELGTRLSKYYSYWVFNNDSLVWAWLKKNPHAQSVPMKLGASGRMSDYWSEYKFSEYFKDYETNLLTEYARMPRQGMVTNCKYSERIPIQKWEIVSDTLTVNSYLCQKATCYFRGRKYTAWFTMEIPVSNGPWKFGGLPGLILKVYDSQKLYTFECVKVENFKYVIRKFDFKTFKTVERLKLLKYQRMFNENFYKTAGLIPLNSGKRPSPISYEPLELY